ncbi:two-component system response regulator KdpE [Denitratisoma oestradiolicum]|uniref:DNA-binding response regulator in two-component regulatory system with KdpD n=1 Tax=Denitratisoma oestradiolicum TaxID=311182 RepID=A0A6S6XPY9_9PROT|nr:two-component system response regulator KdpE [Denitratisoma oestradiolicum]TWO79369.1 two-component system response regulator KdpE [Denitratisoma oestradiolicum]CAB1367981.1 DNA-binding response regulator in two-component regulatory system with KdpD [Denitratisoma oestradiolicum]
MSLSHPSQSGAAVILIVEDEPQIRRFVRGALEGEGWQVAEAASGGSGLLESGTRLPDLVILDLGLPDMDGIDFIRDFRGWSAVPVLVLSARDGESDKIGALDAGADDYLSKPFGVGELLARARALLRRRPAGSDGSPQLAFGEVEVDFVRRRVLRQGNEVHLTPLEYRLLVQLVSHAGKVLTHRHLLREVWGPGYAESSHYLRIYVGRLRQKLETDPARPRHLLTETGVGYRFQP